MKSELETFDGRDNRRELMMLLDRLGSDENRAAFLVRLARLSRNGFAGHPVKVVNSCDAVTAYFILVSCCNELGVSINEAARQLEAEVKERDRCAAVCRS